MITKSQSTSIRTLQILVVFILSALISRTSFAGATKPPCNTKYLTQQAEILNKNTDADLTISVDAHHCRLAFADRHCGSTPFTSYELTTSTRLPDKAMLQTLKIQSFGPNAEETGYILAIPKCAG
jgi:hypothetical protein